MTNLTLFSACVCTWGVPHTFMAFKWAHVMNWWMELEDSKIIQHQSFESETTGVGVPSFEKHQKMEG